MKLPYFALFKFMDTKIGSLEPCVNVLVVHLEICTLNPQSANMKPQTPR